VAETIFSHKEYDRVIEAATAEIKKRGVLRPLAN
jgi:hypothetical protein